VLVAAKTTETNVTTSARPSKIDPTCLVRTSIHIHRFGASLTQSYHFLHDLTALQVPGNENSSTIRELLAHLTVYWVEHQSN